MSQHNNLGAEWTSPKKNAFTEQEQNFRSMQNNKTVESESGIFARSLKEFNMKISQPNKAIHMEFLYKKSIWLVNIRFCNIPAL